MKMLRWILLLGTVALGLSACGSEQKDNYKEAEVNLKKGRYEAALEGYETAISGDYKITEAYRGQGIALLKLNRYEEAIEAFETAIAQDEGGKSLLRDIWMYKAVAEFKNGDTQKALLSCQAAEGLGSDVQSCLLMGKLQLELNQYEEAEASFQRVLEKENSYEMYIDIYQLYVQKNMTGDGETYLKKALELEGKSKEDYYQRGRIYFYMGDMQSARSELIKSSNEGYGDAMLFLGKVYLAGEDSANARAMYQSYMEKEENQAKGYNGLALCDIAEGNYDSALQNIQEGLLVAETEDVKELKYNEIVAYEKKLDFTTAESKLDEYLLLYPDDAAALKEKEFLTYR